jgi:hypothetical protein
MAGEYGGFWNVIRHQVERDVTWDAFSSPPIVWGRGSETTGYAEEAAVSALGGLDVNWGLGWCSPVEGTITSIGCTLVTYVYEAYPYPGSCGSGTPVWIPTSPSSVVYEYSLLGPLPILGSSSNETPSRTLSLRVRSLSSRQHTAPVRLSLPTTRSIELAVYDVLGRRVALLHDGVLGAGEHRFYWPDASTTSTAPGVYFIRLSAETGAALVRRTTVLP